MEACDTVIEEERVLFREKNKICLRVDDREIEIDNKREEIERAEAVMDNQKELLGKDDVTDRHTEEELQGMLNDLNDGGGWRSGTKSREEAAGRQRRGDEGAGTSPQSD